MKCPKCGLDQKSNVECQRCGIIIAKYLQSQQKKQSQISSTLPARNEGVASSKDRQIYVPILIGLGTFMLVAIIFMLFFKNAFSPLQKQAPSTELSDSGETSEAPLTTNVPDRQPAHNPPSESPSTATLTLPTPPSSAPPKLSGIETKLSAYAHPQNKIEMASLATVFIDTGWGTGSGFFIDKTCCVVTNRHVIQSEEREMKEVKNNLENFQKAIKHNEGVLEEHKKYCQSQDFAAKNKIFCSQIEARERELKEMKEQYEKKAALVDKMERGFFDIKVSLIDNTEYFASVIVKSQKYDLALLKISDSGCPRLKPGDLKNLEQGKRVYTIGSPIGLKYTVTSGVVSGQRKIEDIIYIQTDAPINPGNSGGPLLNEAGEVIGINTMAARNARGIGFATPISAVLEEFGHYIQAE